MKFCTECGNALHNPGRGEYLICDQGHLCLPPGPKILVASFVYCGDKLLWMKRRNPPRPGYWAIPAGFMENGETLRETASRELREETCVDIPPQHFKPYMLGSINYISEVYLAFRAEVASTDCACGEESLEVGFFSESELDWSIIAYPSANISVETAYREITDRTFHIYHGYFTDTETRLDRVCPADD